MKNTAKKSWHKEARAFFKQLHAQYDFSDDEARVVAGTCQHLSMYWKAAETLDADGLIVTSDNGMTRKHPCTEIAKNSWAAFLAGCRLLGVCQPHDQKNPVGRPSGGF
jgi:phage terminase small subunit